IGSISRVLSAHASLQLPLGFLHLPLSLGRGTFGSEPRVPGGLADCPLRLSLCLIHFPFGRIGGRAALRHVVLLTASDSGQLRYSCPSAGRTSSPAMTMITATSDLPKPNCKPDSLPSWPNMSPHPITLGRPP